MPQTVRIVNFATDGAARAQRVWSVAQQQPSWVTKIAAVTFLLVIAIPVLFLFFAALIMGLAVFIVLGIAAWILRAVRRILPHRDGRENVIVRRR
ncbi:MAG: hypothetical protein KC983_10910 [Phycisphaerales bacterium]|nr:hypothetical protein [Phycisphaerales bacterium]